MTEATDLRDETQPRLGRGFVIGLLAVTSVGPLSMQLFAPALPSISREFGVSIGRAQLALSLSMVSIAVATLVYGPLSDRLGRRPVLFAGLLLFLAGTLLCTVAGSIEALIWGRVLQAGGAAAGIVVARAIGGDLYGPDQAARIIAYLSAAVVGAPMVAVALGGVITDIGGWRHTFAFAFACGVAAIFFMQWGVPETRSRAVRAADPSGILRDYGRVLHALPSFIGYALHAACGGATFFAFMAAAPHLMADTLDRPASAFGFYFALVTLAFMLSSWVGARWCTRVGVDRMMLAGGVSALVVSLLALIGLNRFGLSEATLFIPAAIIAMSFSLSLPTATAGAVAPLPHVAGTASALLGFLQMIVGAAAAQVAGALSDGSGIPLFLCVAILSAVAVLAGLVPPLRRWRAGLAVRTRP